MTQTHLRWIRMALPVDANWRDFLVGEVYPLLETADHTGVVNQWYFKSVYQRGPLLDVYIETDSSAIHTILRPMLKERFGHMASLEHPNKLLETLSPHFAIVPADVAEDCLTDLHVVSTQIVATHEDHQVPNTVDCLTEVTAALHGVKQGSEWVSSFAKDQFGKWLDRYFHNRSTSNSLADRQAQEAELLKFLKQQRGIEQGVLMHPKKIAWIEGFQELSMLFDGETYIANALNAHIDRYGLSAFQVGQIWLANVREQEARVLSEHIHNKNLQGFS